VERTCEAPVGWLPHHTPMETGAAMATAARTIASLRNTEAPPSAIRNGMNQLVAEPSRGTRPLALRPRLATGLPVQF
jgi:hypothetical protein